MSKKQDVVVVSLSGRVEVENAEPFREACLNAIPSLGKKVVFNMSGLSFVGSNGITPFVKAMVEMSEKSDSTLKFCEVGSEFQRIFAASPLHAIETFESEEHALESLAHGEGSVVPDPMEVFQAAFSQRFSKKL